MTPEEKAQFDKLKQQVEEMSAFIKLLKASATIPFEVQQAFRERFSDLLGFSISSTSANAHDVSIDEAGSSTHVVLNDPTGFFTVTFQNGTQYDVPYYTKP